MARADQVEALAVQEPGNDGQPPGCGPEAG
jgi:hypothetical protein